MYIYFFLQEMNSDFSSQDVSNSSQSTPSISHQLESSTEDPDARLCYTPTYVRNEVSNVSISIYYSEIKFCARFCK